MKVVTRASRPEPYSARFTAAIYLNGTARAVATPAWASVPYNAWYTPPANSPGIPPRSEWVHQSVWVIAYRPRSITTHNTQISGISATTNEARNSIVAMPFLTRRAVLTGRKAAVLTGSLWVPTLIG